MTYRIRHFLVVLLVGVLVASVVPFAATTPATAAPGFETVPDANIKADLPAQAPDRFPTASEFEGSTLTNRGADTLEVTISTRSRALGLGQSPLEPKLALVLRDDVREEGRTVALPAAPIVDALGHRPKMVSGLHESGERWTAHVRREGHLLKFDVPHFSTNTITFTGQVDLTANPAVDGSTLTYDVDDLDAADNFTIDVTGHTATESDLESAGKVGDSQSMSVSIAGNTDPTGPSATNSPELEVTGQREVASVSGSGGGGTIGFAGNDTDDTDSHNSEIRVDNAPKNITEVDLHVDLVGYDEDDYVEFNYDVYIVEENPDSVYGEGTLFGSGTYSDFDGGGRPSITVTNSSGLTTAGGNVTIEIVTTSVIDSGWVAMDVDSGSGYFTTNDGFDKGEGTATLSSPAPNGVSIDADDGTSVSYGDFSVGETKTKDYNLSTSATSLSVSTTSGYGTVDLVLNYTERTQTVDPAVEVNGHWTNHTGTLADGSTTALSTNTSWLQDGTNRVNISVGDGTLSTDAPTPAVELAYSHDTVSKQAVDYTAEKWTERYNVSKTYASESRKASLTIPFESTVSSIRSIEIRTNGSGSWSTVASSNYQLDGTTLTVDLDGELGTIQSGETVEVRASGSKVVVYNGAITVTDPTVLSSDLNTTFTVDSLSGTLKIGVENASGGNKVHHVTDASWSAAEWAKIDAGGSQTIELPNAKDGGSATIETIPVEVSPDTGEVKVRVTSADSSPAFKVRPGASSGDLVSYTYLNAEGGTTYELWSITDKETRDSAEASSPVTLEDDDSEETLEILASSSSGDTGGGGGGGGDGANVSSSVSVTTSSALFVALAAALLAVVWFLSQQFGSGTVSTRLLFIGEAALVGILALETLSPASLVAAVGSGLEAILASLGGGLETAMPLVVLGVIGLAFLYLRNRGKPTKVVNFQLGRGGSE